MVASFHGKKQSIGVLREAAGTDRHGTNLAGLVEAAKAIGFDARGVRATKDALREIQFPAIAHWSEGGRNHFVVVFKFNNKRVTVGDPAQGLRKLTPEEFGKHWTGVLALLKPTPNLRQLGDPSLGKLWSLLRPHRKLFAHALLAAVLITILGLSSSFFIQILVDVVFVAEREPTLNWLGAGMMLVLLARTGLQAFQTYLLAHLSQRIDTEIALGYHHHLLGLPLDFFWSRRTGEILSRLGDATRIRAAASGTSLSIIVDALMLVVTALVMLWLHWTMAIVALLLVPVLAVTLWLLSGPIRDAQRKAMERAAHFESHLVDAIGAIDSVKAFRAEDRLRLRGEVRFVEMIQAVFRSQMFNMYSSTATVLLVGLSGLGLLWLGGHEVLDGSLTVGQLMALYTLLGMITGPIERLATANLAIQDGLVAAERLAEVLNVPDEKERQRKVALNRRIEGHIEFRDVRFAYGSRPPVLDDLSLSIEAGECCRISGPSGSGKSTAVRLLARLIEPDNGQVLIDGVNVQDYQLENLRQQVVYVGQEPYLLSASVADNIRLGCPTATPEEVFGAASRARMDTFVDRLPHGYDSVIGERGVTLSGGERQRIALARAIVMDPPILVLDEPANHLDRTCTAAVLKIIEDRRRKRRTTIVISHDPITVDRTVPIGTEKLDLVGAG